MLIGNTAGMETKNLIFVYIVNRSKKRFKDSQTVTGKLVGFFSLAWMRSSFIQLLLLVTIEDTNPRFHMHPMSTVTTQLRSNF